MPTDDSRRERRDARMPRREVVAIVTLFTAGAIVAFVASLLTYPVDAAIGLPFSPLGLDPVFAGVAVWVVVGLATSSRSVVDEGRVTILYGVGPIIAAAALGGPTAAAWVALIGTFELRELRGDVPWYGVVANHAMMVIPAVVAGIAILGLEQAAPAGTGVAGELVAVMTGAMLFWVIALAFSVATVWARNGRRPAEALGVPWRSLCSMMVAESALAWLFALAYRQIAWWSPVVFVLADVAASGSLDRGRAGWLARHHQVTNLPNRVALVERAKDLRRSGRRGAYVFYLDLDGFKAVNDTYDHDVGDDVLRVVAERLSGVKRRDDFLAHFHGDEFVLLAPGIATEEEATGLIERVTTAVEAPIEVAEGTVHVSVSVGYRVITDLRSLDEEIRLADRRMTVVKRERAVASGRVRRVG